MKRNFPKERRAIEDEYSENYDAMQFFGVRHRLAPGSAVNGESFQRLRLDSLESFLRVRIKCFCRKLSKVPPLKACCTIFQSRIRSATESFQMLPECSKMEINVRDRIEREAASAFGLAMLIYGPPICRTVLPIFVKLFCARPEAFIQPTRLASSKASKMIFFSNQQWRIYDFFDIAFVGLFLWLRTVNVFKVSASLCVKKADQCVFGSIEIFASSQAGQLLYRISRI